MSVEKVDDQQEIYATLLEVNEEPTALYKILKIANLVSGGGEAKQFISEGYVFLNGEEETRKRKKVYAGDLVCFNGEYLQIAIKGETEGYELIEQSTLTTPEVNEVSATAKKKPIKRKPISF